MRLLITSLLITAAAGSASAQWASTAYTPWSDPDLQVMYTNTYENGTAFARAEERQRAR
jgi:hypothetical protein